MYAGDAQIYLSLETSKPVVESLKLYIHTKYKYLMKNKLKFNDAKTEFMLISSARLKYE